MSDTRTQAQGQHVRSLAKGGSLNLVGAVVYGASGFAVLWIVNRALGPAEAGAVLLAIAAYNIVAKVAELGCATALVRWISRATATHRADQIPAIERNAVLPVAAASIIAAAALWLGSDTLARWLSHGDDAETLAGALRAMAPFLPMSSLNSVLVQGTRGFGTMTPQVGIEKIGRGLAMPLMMAVAWKLGASAPLIAGAWALTAAPALVASMSAFRSLSRRARSESPPAAEDFSARADFAAQDFGDDRNRRFWRFASARAIGQTFEVGVNWVDTLIIGAMLSATQAGIYASGTRYALLGSFTSDAMMQVSGPSVAASLARGDREEANRSVRHVTAWQTLLVWPMYLLVLCFSTPLLQVFGHTTVEARPALMFLSLGMMIQSLAGPAASVILMDGKSTTALFNTMISLGFNVLANLWAIPRYGISGAGAVWAITIVIQGWLPAFQAHTTLRIATFGRPGVMASLCALFSFGVVGIVFRLIFGETWAGLVIALVVGSMLFVPMVWANRKVLALDALVPRRFLDRMGPRGDSSLGGTLDTTAHRSRS